MKTSIATYAAIDPISFKNYLAEQNQLSEEVKAFAIANDLQHLDEGLLKFLFYLTPFGWALKIVELLFSWFFTWLGSVIKWTFSGVLVFSDEAQQNSRVKAAVRDSEARMRRANEPKPEPSGSGKKMKMSELSRGSDLSFAFANGNMGTIEKALKNASKTQTMLHGDKFVKSIIQSVKDGRDIWTEFDMSQEDRKTGQRYNEWIQKKIELEDKLKGKTAEAQTSLDPEFVAEVMIKLTELVSINAMIWNFRKEIMKIYKKVSK